MASMYKTGNVWNVQFPWKDKRHTHRPKGNKRRVEQYCHHVEVLLEARTLNTAVPLETAQWFAELTDKG